MNNLSFEIKKHYKQNPNPPIFSKPKPFIKGTNQCQKMILLKKLLL